MISGRFDLWLAIRRGLDGITFLNHTVLQLLNYGKIMDYFHYQVFQTRLGGGKKDFSMLFVYAASDYYLIDEGKLGFLITQEVFKIKRCWGRV